MTIIIDKVREIPLHKHRIFVVASILLLISPCAIESVTEEILDNAIT